MVETTPEARQGLWRRLRNPPWIAQPRSRCSEHVPKLLPVLSPPFPLSLLTVLLLPCRLECPSLPTSTTMGWCTWPASATCCWTTPSRRRASAWAAWSPSAPSRTLSGVWAAWALLLGPQSLGKGFARSRVGFGLVLSVFPCLDPCVCPCAVSGVGGAVCRQRDQHPRVPAGWRPFGNVLMSPNALRMCWGGGVLCASNILG